MRRRRIGQMERKILQELAFYYSLSADELAGHIGGWLPAASASDRSSIRRALKRLVEDGLILRSERLGYQYGHRANRHLYRLPKGSAFRSKAARAAVHERRAT